MVESLIAVTAIRDSESEGFVTSTLYSQGWDINFRALDFESLISYLQTQESQPIYVLISTDFDGLSATKLHHLSSMAQKIIIFQASHEDGDSYPDAIPLPKDPLELISLMRGSLRTPMIRPRRISTVQRIAKVVALSSVSGGVGCSTFAYNLAIELTALERRVLLVDADPYSPSQSVLLGERGLHLTGQGKRISHLLQALECTQENISACMEVLEHGLGEFDFIVLDLGQVRDIASQLSGRRWSSQVFTWVSNCADSLYIMAPSDRVGLERLRSLVSQLTQNAMKPSFNFIQVMRQIGKRENKGGEKFLQIVTPLRPGNIAEYPFDPRSVLKAENEESSLLDSNERGVVRRAIADLAGELAS